MVNSLVCESVSIRGIARILKISIVTVCRKIRRIVGSIKKPPIALHQKIFVLDIDQSRTKANSPETNGICERFHRTIQDEFYETAFRKKIYTTLEELQTDLDSWLNDYNHHRTHTGKYCYGRTPMQTFLETLFLAMMKMLQDTPPAV